MSSSVTLSASSKRPWPATDEDSDTVAPSNKKAKPKGGGCKATSSLIPTEERRKAVVGTQDESLLLVTTQCSKTGKIGQLVFRNKLHHEIDWCNPHHIAKINAWRNQIYGRAGMKAKEVTMWLPKEELWFELYFRLSITKAQSGRMITPKTRDIMKSFNKTFSSASENSRDDRSPGYRSVNAFSSKLNRMCTPLRERLETALFGRTGPAFVPDISLDMLESFAAMKDDLAVRSIRGEDAESEAFEKWRCCYSAQSPREGAPKRTRAANEPLSPPSSDPPTSPAVISTIVSTPAVAPVLPEHYREALRIFPSLDMKDLAAAETLLRLSRQPATNFF